MTYVDVKIICKECSENVVLSVRPAFANETDESWRQKVANWCKQMHNVLSPNCQSTELEIRIPVSERQA